MTTLTADRPFAVKDAQQVLDVDPVQGLIRAIVSVTGVVDEVGDIIEPGAYAKTLKARTPKCCDGHDWAKPIGVAVAAEEWLPGDARLPTETKDGKPWPKAAGALVCDIQFNLDTDRGDQAFKDVRFYSDRGVAEWSIGYQVPAGKATRDKNGVRHIKEVDLYTVDPVLFGAAPLSMTLDIKSAQAVLARLGATSDGEGAEFIERKGGDPADLPVMDYEAKYDTSPVGTPGGRQNWVDKAGGLPAFIRAIAHALIRSGKSESNAIQIAVGTVQRWARGEGNVSEKTRAKASAAIAEWEKKKAASHAKGLIYDPALEVGPDAGTVTVETKTTNAEPEPAAEPGDGALDVKAFPNLPGTMEERLEQVRAAVQQALKPAPADTGDNGGGDRPRAVECYVSVDGTTATAVIASVHDWDSGERRTVQMDYTVSDDGTVVLGPPEDVRLVVVPQPLNDSDDTAEGDDSLDEDLEEWLATMADWLPPLDGMVDAVTGSVAKVLAMVPETKAGRVLSGSNAGLLRQAVEHLIAVLKAAGIDVNPNQAPAQAGDTPDTTAATEPAVPVAGKSYAPQPGELIPGLPDPAAVLGRIDSALV